MNAPTRLAAFAAVLGLAFGAAALAGAALDPAEETRAMDGHASPAHREAGDPAPARGPHGAGATAPPAGGLAASEEGLTLEPERAFLRAGKPERFAFRIVDARGRALREQFELESEREMHLVVVRRDAATYDHLHPRRGSDGTWAVDMTLPRPGAYRAFADFTVDGRRRVLAVDLFAPGDFRPEPLPAPSTAAGAGGLDVALRTAGLAAGRAGELTFSVTRDGHPLEGVEPYLGARGHVVALREGDLAYLHVHPAGGAGHGGPDSERGHGSPRGRRGHGAEHAAPPTGAKARSNEIRFAATFPTAGRYRLFLQFRAGGELRTVAYTLEVPR